MRKNRTTPRRLACVAIALAAILLACGGDGGELREANSDVMRIEAEGEAIRTRVSEAQKLVEEADAALQSAREELASAEEELAGAEKELTAARERVESEASDAPLFRAVQGRLMEREFEDVAISAQVRNRVVTLQGRVPNAELKARAEEIAASTPGVATVVNQIEVEAAKSE